VVIISRDERLQHRRNVTIAEVTRVVRELPCEVPLSRNDGMPVDCVINTDNLHTIPQDQLRDVIVTLGAERLFQLNQSLEYSLDLQA
jgi:mRNA interferase MazF